MNKAEAAREWTERSTAREWLMRFLYGVDVNAGEVQNIDDWFAVYEKGTEERNAYEKEPTNAEDADCSHAKDKGADKEEFHDLNEKQKEFIRQSVVSIMDNLEEIDDVVAKHLKGWEYSRLPKVDKAILRLAVNEILYNTNIPVGASINEAVELSKRYSGESSFRFLNGVLGNIARERES